MSAASEAVRLRKASSMSGSVLRTATSPARQKRSAWSAPHNSKAGSAPWRARRSSWAATAMAPLASTNIYALIRLVTAGRIHILPASPCASLDLVPIDHVIGGLTDIAERMMAVSGGTYHLVSGAPVPLAALRTLALGYQHLHAPRFVPPETFERARLTRAEQTLDRHVTSRYASYLQRDPWFQNANLRALSGRTCPRPDRAFLQRLIDYGIATGYLTAGALSGHRYPTSWTKHERGTLAGVRCASDGCPYKVAV